MRVKRYVVDTMPDALKRIRSDLGKDAVILNTKEIRSGGFLGLFSKKKIEVIAAIETAASTDTAAVNGRMGKQSSPAVLTAIQTAVAAETKPASIAIFNEPMPYVPDVILREVTSVKETTAPTPIPKSVSVKEDRLFEEIRQMKELVSRLSAQNGLSAMESHPLYQEMNALLTAQEVHPTLIHQWLNNIWGEDTGIIGEEKDRGEIFRKLRSEIYRHLSSSPAQGISASTQIVHFVGPTGVGKTTTIAKLAAEQVLKNQRKVGFITSDTYRIAAIEQLKTYANILNIPLEVVFSPQDLPKAFTQLADRDMIFMDTAGRNFRNEMYVSELNSLLHSKGNTETILVLSLTAKYKDMKVITENFSRFKLDKVLFTKRDETDTYGAILNLINDFPLKLSYITNGQNVPDDITPADINRIIDWLLEERSHE